ncbi:MAG: magnesium transport protein CorA [Herpetosiphonaceae bacterium]|nr:MAG: magnesium transport protein CorA [Herpetosiphonaceae bacterium]
MIRSIYCPTEGPRQFDLSPEQICAALQDSKGLLWVSLEHPTKEELHTILGDIFHFHPLTIEDCESLGYQAPKVDNFGDYLFIIVHALKPDFPLDHLDTMELNCFLGPNYLVTSYLDLHMPAVDELWEKLERDQRSLERGADMLCHAILDTIVDEYLPIIDLMDEEIDKLEDLVLARPQPYMLERLLDIKHSILTLRRVIAPQREVMNRLSRDDLLQIRPANRIYFRDVYDHLVRLHDISESVRDIVGGALDIYLSSTSNRMNQIVKTLTIVSTIFLPLTFLAGVYGMNFDVMPELRWRYGYFFMWGVFITIALGMLWLFRRKGWL